MTLFDRLLLGPNGASYALVWSNSVGINYYDSNGLNTVSDESNYVSATAYGSNKKLASDSQGNLHVVWEDRRGTYHQIYYAKSVDGGRSWVETAITSESGDQHNPSIAVDGNDFIYIVWFGAYSGSSYNQIRYTKFDTSWGAIQNLTSESHNQYHPSIVVDSDGFIHVVWAGTHSGSIIYDQIRYVKFTTSWGSIQNLTSESYSQSNPSIVVDSDDYIHVVWSGAHSGSVTYDQIRYAKFDTSWGSIDNLTSDDYNQIYPSIAVDSNNHIHVVWFGAHSGSSYNQIRYVEFDTSWGSIENLTSDSYNQVYPSVAVDEDDCIRVVWFGRHSGSVAYDQIRYIEFVASWGSIQSLTSESYGQYYPNIISKSIASEYLLLDPSGDNLLLQPDGIQHSTDALLYLDWGSVEHSTDASLIWRGEPDHTTDAFLRYVINKDHSTDGMLWNEVLLEQSTSAFLVPESGVVHATGALVYEENDLTHGTDAYLEFANVSHSTDSSLWYRNRLAHDADAWLYKPDNLLDHRTNAYLVDIVENGHSTDALLISGRDHTTDAELYGPARHGTSALLYDEFGIDHGTDSRLYWLRIIDHGTDALLYYLYRSFDVGFGFPGFGFVGSGSFEPPPPYYPDSPNLINRRQLSSKYLWGVDGDVSCDKPLKPYSCIVIGDKLFLGEIDLFNVDKPELLSSGSGDVESQDWRAERARAMAEERKRLRGSTSSDVSSKKSEDVRKINKGRVKKKRRGK